MPRLRLQGVGNLSLQAVRESLIRFDQQRFVVGPSAAQDNANAAVRAGSVRGQFLRGRANGNNRSLDAVDIAIKEILVDVANGLVQEQPIHRIGADGPILSQLPLHSQAEMVGLAGRVLRIDQLGSGFEQADGGHSQIGVVGIDTQFLDGGRAHRRQDVFEQRTVERRRAGKIQRCSFRDARNSGNWIGNDAARQVEIAGAQGAQVGRVRSAAARCRWCRSIRRHHRGRRSCYLSMATRQSPASGRNACNRAVRGPSRRRRK